MATRLYGLSPGETPGVAGTVAIAEGAGSATSADSVEVTIDLATTTVHTAATTRGMTQDEALECLQRIMDHIAKGNWPPA